jgi:hypothetical protein
MLAMIKNTKELFKAVIGAPLRKPLMNPAPCPTRADQDSFTRKSKKQIIRSQKPEVRIVDMKLLYKGSHQNQRKGSKCRDDLKLERNLPGEINRVFSIISEKLP